MKLRQIIVIGVFWGSLFVSNNVVCADEAKMGGINTSLGNGTIGGYVDTTVDSQAPIPPGHIFFFHRWMHSFFLWFHSSQHR